MPRVIALVLTVLMTATACGAHAEADAASTKPPSAGICRMLTAGDVTRPSNADAAVSCSEPHDSETYAVGELDEKFADAAYDDPAIDTWAYQTCAAAFPTFLGSDQSTAMRSLLTWIWFRPSKAAWEAGARWYRCDVLGGSATQHSYVDLPTTTEGLLSGRPADPWMACARGKTVASGTTVPCSMPHDWRAATTIKLGEAGDAYPGDVSVKAKTRSYCSESVDAWLGYPASYGYGYTWFGAREWAAGNRRSVCWARTSE
ncbi:MAG: septum formation family protein [Nocardioides sp.]